MFSQTWRKYTNSEFLLLAVCLLQVGDLQNITATDYQATSIFRQSQEQNATYSTYSKYPFNDQNLYFQLCIISVCVIVIIGLYLRIQKIGITFYAIDWQIRVLGTSQLTKKIWSRLNYLSCKDTSEVVLGLLLDELKCPPSCSLTPRQICIGLEEWPVYRQGESKTS